MEQNQLNLQHIELSIITTPEQHHQRQCPIHKNIQQQII